MKRFLTAAFLVSLAFAPLGCGERIATTKKETTITTPTGKTTITTETIEKKSGEKPPDVRP